MLVEWYTEPVFRQGHAVCTSFCATEVREAVVGVIQLFGPHRLTLWQRRQSRYRGRAHERRAVAEDGFDACGATARNVMIPGIHCCREDDDLAKAVRHMEALKVRRLPVINKSKWMVGVLSLGDISEWAPGDLLSECVKSIRPITIETPVPRLLKSIGELRLSRVCCSQTLTASPAARERNPVIVKR